MLPRIIRVIYSLRFGRRRLSIFSSLAVSLHGFHAGSSDCLAVVNRSSDQTKSLITILPMLIGVALGFGISAPAWLAVFEYVHGSARETQPANRALAVDRALAGIARISPSLLDG